MFCYSCCDLNEIDDLRAAKDVSKHHRYSTSSRSNAPLGSAAEFRPARKRRTQTGFDSDSASLVVDSWPSVFDYDLFANRIKYRLGGLLDHRGDDVIAIVLRLCFELLGERN